jgi:hypothetical protein
VFCYVGYITDYSSRLGLGTGGRETGRGVKGERREGARDGVSVRRVEVMRWAVVQRTVEQ